MSASVAELSAATFPPRRPKGAPLETLVNGGFDLGADGWESSDIDGSGGWRASGGNPGGYDVVLQEWQRGPAHVLSISAERNCDDSSYGIDNITVDEVP